MDNQRWNKFIMIPKVVSRDETLTAQTRSVYMALASFVDDQTKEGKPSRNRIAARAGVSKNTLTKHFKILSDKGYITIETRVIQGVGNMTNSYTLNNV